VERWHLEETYALVKASFGSKQENVARDSTRSVLDRQWFTGYHYTEALRLTRDFDRRYLTGSLLIDLHGQDGERKRAAFERYIRKAGAHATAAVQSMHAIPDILAHAMFFATARNLRPDAPEPRKVAVPTVVASLRRDQRFKSLAPLLAATQSGNLWRHLAALANLSKHRTVVRAALSEDWTGERENHRELQFRACEYNGIGFPQLSLQALLEPEHHRLSIAVLSLGHELNACLRSDAA
jgi:hypothetical protein